MFVETQLLKWRDCLVDILFEILTNGQGTIPIALLFQLIHFKLLFSVVYTLALIIADLATNTLAKPKTIILV